MATNFPASLDTVTQLPNPAVGNNTNSPSHASLHGNENGAIIAIEGKVGIGATTPAANQLLFGTGTGTSAWQGLTSAQLASILSDETGSGSAVFATTPTLVTPKVDTINENTPGNGTTIGGVNIKSGALNTNNSVVTANITNGAVTANKLATGAATAYVATAESLNTTGYTDLTTITDSVTVTIGANGLALVALASYCINTTSATIAYAGFAMSGTNTLAASDKYAMYYQSFANSAFHKMGITFLMTGLSAGSTTFKMKYKASGNFSTWQDRMISVVPL